MVDGRLTYSFIIITKHCHKSCPYDLVLLSWFFLFVLLFFWSLARGHNDLLVYGTNSTRKYTASVGVNNDRLALGSNLGIHKQHQDE